MAGVLAGHAAGRHHRRAVRARLPALRPAARGPGQLQDLPTLNLAIFLSYLFVSFTVGAFVSLKLLVPVFRWQRRDALLAEDDPATTEAGPAAGAADALLPLGDQHDELVLGAVVFIAASWPVASHAAPVVAVATALGADATSIIGYLQSERVLRPVAVAALRGGVPEKFHRPGVIQRQVLTWVLSTGVPLLAIVLAVVASKFSLLTASADSCSRRSCCWRSPRW